MAQEMPPAPRRRKGGAARTLGLLQLRSHLSWARQSLWGSGHSLLGALPGWDVGRKPPPYRAA